jgi:hypothetical protein
VAESCGIRCQDRPLEHEFVAGGRRWIRTSGLLHVKHFRLSAVLGAWEAEQNRDSYTVTKTRALGGPPSPGGVPKGPGFGWGHATCSVRRIVVAPALSLSARDNLCLDAQVLRRRGLERMQASGAPNHRQERLALIVVTVVVVLPLLAAIGVMAFGLMKTASPSDAGGFLLLVGPGACVFLVGLGISLVSPRHPQRRLLGVRLQVSGTTLALLIPDVWLAWNAATGATSPVAWLGVAVLTFFVVMRVLVLRSLRLSAT